MRELSCRRVDWPRAPTVITLRSRRFRGSRDHVHAGVQQRFDVDDTCLRRRRHVGFVELLGFVEPHGLVELCGHVEPAR